MEKGWPKRPSNYQLQEAQKKILIGPYSCVGGNPCPYTLGLPGSPQPSSCTTFMLNSHQGRAAIGKKKSCIYVCRVALVMSNSLRPCTLWPARLLCQGGGEFSRQEHWSVLANTVCHTLLEHYISSFPSHQLP